ncbi:MAG: hypothetical protein SOR38_04885 [Oscillospiraceae bacterium]|nr:hypothetical protein [Oscillospiraceae bacterium]MDY3065131.1 hypothetical protein [Oscillospiraceae bacterium]
MRKSTAFLSILCALFAGTVFGFLLSPAKNSSFSFGGFGNNTTYNYHYLNKSEEDDGI